MVQLVDEVNVTAKIDDKIMQIENRRRKKFTQEEKDIAYEMFMSGFLFGVQWADQETYFV